MAAVLVVRRAFEADLLVQANHCHCGPCRKHSGTAVCTQACVLRQQFRLLQGEELIRVYGKDEGALKLSTGVDSRGRFRLRPGDPVTISVLCRRTALTSPFDFDTPRFIKTKNLRRKPAAVAKGRWAAYATAGAASAFTCVNSAEATIHYSGIIHKFFGSNPCDNDSVRFQLDQPGDSFRLRHTWVFNCSLGYGGYAHFGIRGRAGNAVAGFYNSCPSAHVVSMSKLNRGQFISRRPFIARNSGLLGAHRGPCGTLSVGQFDPGDVGFIGFKFNNGSGDQYGWVRIKMATDTIDYPFWLVDYAYADPGEPIRAGQTSSNEMVPEKGSLGALALGAAGLLAWRKSRSRKL